MKNNLLLTAIFTAVLALSCSKTAGARNNEAPAALMLNHYAARDFIEGAIPAGDLDIIIQAGIRAPSAANRQPWHFTVVQDQDLAKKIIANNVNGNVFIVVSAAGDGKTNGVQILDCALAVQNIYLAAQALGYGSRIYTGPMDNLNSNLKDGLSLPNSHSAVALVRIGKVQPPADTVSAASARKNPEETVSYR